MTRKQTEYIAVSSAVIVGFFMVCFFTAFVVVGLGLQHEGLFLINAWFQAVLTKSKTFA